MEDSISYVVGFMLSNELTDVVMIEKQKPEWQKGCFNGVGGRIEPFETMHEAMAREFSEETGVKTSAGDWFEFASLDTDNPNVSTRAHVHYLFCLQNYEKLSRVRTMTNEEISIRPLLGLISTASSSTIKMTDNTKWILPLMLIQAKRLVAGQKMSYISGSERY